MSKRRGPGEQKRLDPEDVLAGRVKVTAVELLDLVHRVNPTGRELGAREAELRYAQKSRLQSLLVRRFGDELEVVADPEREGTVSIVHRGHGRDACHAVVDALDEEARAWVRLKLDLGPPSSEGSSPVAPAARPSGRGLPPPREIAGEEEGSPPSSQATPESLVRRAGDAALAYDYERARAHLERALEASGGAAGPAAALLALLVDTLGDDAGALEIQASILSRAALADPEVRGLLALAAARSGEHAQAVALLRGASERRAGEAVAALAAGAVAAGDPERAAAHLADLRRRDPTHAAIAELMEEIALARKAERGPAEAEVAALAAAGREDEAERKAAEVLSRWPESEAARRVIRAAEERRRQAKEDAGRRARERDATEQARRDAERVERVRAALAEPDPREGLLAWLELDPALRRKVDAKGAALLLRWLEQTPGRAAPRARVEAVTALAGARRRLPGDPQGAIDALALHEAALERVDEAKRIALEAHAELRAARAAGARATVLEARRELDGGDAAAALARLEAAVLRDLGETERAGAEALRAEAGRIVAKDKRAAEVGRLRQAGMLFEARALAEELRDAAEGDERAHWEEERRAIHEAAQRAFVITVDREPRPLGAEPYPDPEQTMFDAPIWLTEDGRTAVLVEGHERWVWVQIVDVGAQTVRAEVLLRTPEPMGDVYVQVLGRTAWLTGFHGALLALDVDRLEVVDFRRAREMVPAGYRRGQPVIAAVPGGPAPRYFWHMPADAEGFGGLVQVIDLEQRKVVREIPGVIRVGALPGTREARIALYKPRAVAVHEERGAPAPGGRIPLRDVVTITATVHPSGEGLVMGGKGMDGRPNPGALFLVEALRGGPARAPWLVPGTEEGGTIMSLVTSLDTGLVCLQHVKLVMGWELFVLRPAGDGFEIVHRSGVPDHTALARDAGSRHVVAFASDPLVLAPIGPTVPELPPYVKDPEPWIGDVIGAPACLGNGPERAKMYQQVRDAEKAMPGTSGAELCRTLDQPGRLLIAVEHARGLATAGDAAEAQAQAMRDLLWERHPEAPHVRLLRADERARLGFWEEVREVLAPCTGASFDGDSDSLKHVFHLLALAALHLGDREEALRCMTEAFSHYGACPLHAIADVLDVDLVVEGAEPSEAPPPSLLRQLVRALKASDARLAAGDPAGALAALDPRRFRDPDEVQLFARRAEAWLRLSPAGGPRRIAKIMALAELIDANLGSADEPRSDLPIPGVSWARGRLDDLAARARAWLDAQTRGDEGA
jgi:hypothetical protein